jgi:hypothetical protein
MEKIMEKAGLIQHERPATVEDIREIIGPFEDDVVVRILRIHPTLSEVKKAFTWLRSDEYLLRHLEHELRGRAALVFDVLEQEYPDLDGSQM